MRRSQRTFLVRQDRQACDDRSLVLRGFPVGSIESFRFCTVAYGDRALVSSSFFMAKYYGRSRISGHAKFHGAG